MATLKEKFESFIDKFNAEDVQEQKVETKKEPVMAEETKNPDLENKLDQILETQAEIKKWQDDIDSVEAEPQQEAAPVEEPKEDPLAEQKAQLAKQQEELAKQMEEMKTLKKDLEEHKPEAFEHNPEANTKQKGNDYLMKMNDPNFYRNTDPVSRFVAYAESVGIKGGVDPTK